MPEKSSVFGIDRSSWIWLLISLIIPLIGVFILQWNLFALLYLFWIELILLGSFSTLRIICASNGEPFLHALCICMLCK